MSNKPLSIRRIEQLARAEISKRPRHSLQPLEDDSNNSISGFLEPYHIQQFIDGEISPVQLQTLQHTMKEEEYYSYGEESDESDTDSLKSGDDSDYESESNNETGEFNIKTFITDFKEFCKEAKFNKKQITKTLKFLRKHTCFCDLPKDSRTVFKTNKNEHEVQEQGNGEFVYFGLKPYLNSLSATTVHEVQLNFDGVPLYRSSLTSFWPILGHFPNEDFEPFVIGIYCGPQKPEDPAEYLRKLVDEIKTPKSPASLEKVKIKSIVCDAPALAYIKQIKGHSGYHSCTRCTVEGIYYDYRMSFYNLECAPRTDKSFRDGDDGDHHIGETILEEILSLDMIKDFALDYMHIVCLGVVKKLITLWVKGPVTPNKLPSIKLKLLNDRLKEYSVHISSEFVRRPKSVGDFERWKATELRQFLLYSGPVVLSGIISPENYEMFMSLSVAIRILSIPKFHITWNEYANSLLRFFVDRFGRLYGEKFVSYNFHALIHLAEDVKLKDPLDESAAFRFENLLGKIKRLLRSPKNPLAQVIYHLQMDGIHLHPRKSAQVSFHEPVPFTQSMWPNVRLDNIDQCYKMYKTTKWRMSHKKDKDAYFMTKQKKLIKICGIMKTKNNGVLISSKLFTNYESLFLSPCEGSLLGMHKFNIHSFSVNYIISMDEIMYKCQTYPLTPDISASVPLLHSQ